MRPKSTCLVILYDQHNRLYNSKQFGFCSKTTFVENLLFFSLVWAYVNNEWAYVNIIKLHISNLEIP